ncbi:hypothetical protein MPER_01795, partial [Moniliophthora perniciosa FA553]
MLSEKDEEILELNRQLEERPRKDKGKQREHPAGPSRNSDADREAEVAGLRRQVEEAQKMIAQLKNTRSGQPKQPAVGSSSSSQPEQPTAGGSSSSSPSSRRTATDGSSIPSCSEIEERWSYVSHWTKNLAKTMKEVNVHKELELAKQSRPHYELFEEDTDSSGAIPSQSAQINHPAKRPGHGAREEVDATLFEPDDDDDDEDEDEENDG